MDDVGNGIPGGSGTGPRTTGSRTLARGLTVLMALGRMQDGATVSGLAEATALDRAVLYRLLETLTSKGFVRRDTDSRRYSLGLTMLELGVRAARGLDVRQLADQPLKELVREANETGCLAVRDRDDLVLVDVEYPADRFVHIDYRVGQRTRLEATAHGRALLAFLAEAVRDDSLHPVKRRGIAHVLDELEQGTSAIAAPIFDHTGFAIASVGIIAPTPRLPNPEPVALQVLRTAREISERLGWRPRQPSN